jgi:sugar O-acyltransferase (sialic acid O-acetyltransferase NeuD family)
VKKPLLIFGAGGFAREVLQVALDCLVEPSANTFPLEPVAFAVDAAFADRTPVHGLPVLEPQEAFARFPDALVVIAIGSPVARRRIAAAVESGFGPRWATLVHPRSWLGRRVQTLPGAVVCAGCQITTDIRLGAHAHINIGCTIGHDANLDDFVTLNPGVHVSGNVTIGEGAEIGTGSVLIPHANVGAWSTVGAGSVVTRPLERDVTAVGAPARVVKSRAMGWHLSEPGRA